MSLLDANVLLALAWPNHQFHAQARSWLAARGKETWCTCAITDLGFVRLSSNPAYTAHAKTPLEAVLLLAQLTNRPEHRFLNDSPSATTPAFHELARRLQGHQQVTDAYLVTLAHEHGTTLATFDHRVAKVAPNDAVELVNGQSG